MGEAGAQQENLPQVNLRSLNSNETTFVAFVSRTNRKVDIFWIDYKGKHVKYATLSKYGDTFTIHTFITHPWTFRDSESGDQLIDSENNEVLFPKPLEVVDNLNLVLIGIPGKYVHQNILGFWCCTRAQG